MKIKHISLNNFKDIDIRLFYFLKRLFFTHRIKIYSLLFLIVFREFSSRIPYLNVFIASHLDVINVTFTPLLLAVFIGFNGRKLIMLSVALFLPSAILTLIGHETTAVQLANIIYGLLTIGIVVMIVNSVRGKDV